MPEDKSATTAAGDAEQQDPANVLPLVAQLRAALDAAGVSYCHWKSNEAIARSASGENDLDLLVARRDAATFAAVLHDQGFRVARPPADRQLPGIIDYYGIDDATTRLVHVHAHYRLMLGDDTTKNVRLPVEEAYLRSVTYEEVLPLPSPEFEYVLFALRMVLKHATWDAQLDRKDRLAASERRELAYLQQRIDPQVVERLVEKHLPSVGPELFAACAEAAGGRVGRVTRAATARRLLRALRTYSRRPGALDLALRLWRRRWKRVQRRLPGAMRRKRPDTGGLLIAVVGGDGSGKTSAVDFLIRLLARDFETRRVHLGKPPKSRLTTVVKRPMGRLRRFGLFPALSLPRWTDFEAFPGLSFVLWHTLTARDRYREYARAHRALVRGALVVCDRFPMPALRYMDGARTEALPGLEHRPIARWLAAREAWYYSRIRAPDLLFVLQVPPDVAVERRVGDDPESVRRRVASVHDVDWARTDAVVVEASRPEHEVHAELRDVVWASF